MKTAIDYLQSKGVIVSPDGAILSGMPDGLEGISIIDTLEEITESHDYCYTIIDSKITKIDL